MHGGMNVAVICKGACLSKRKRKRASRREIAAVEYIRIGGNCVCRTIIVGPNHGGAHFDLKTRWLEGKIADGHTRIGWHCGGCRREVGEPK